MNTLSFFIQFVGVLLLVLIYRRLGAILARADGLFLAESVSKAYKRGESETIRRALEGRA